jgi:hypothetical protein
MRSLSLHYCFLATYSCVLIVDDLVHVPLKLQVWKSNDDGCLLLVPCEERNLSLSEFCWCYNQCPKPLPLIIVKMPKYICTTTSAQCLSSTKRVTIPCQLQRLGTFSHSGNNVQK